MPTSNIDDLLMGGKTTQHPETPENPYLEGPEEIEEIDSNDHDFEEDPEPEPLAANNQDDDEDDGAPKEAIGELDEYGNEQEPERMYTAAEHKELVNKAVRERLSRLERNNPDVMPHTTQQQIQQQTKEFEFDPDSDKSLPQQLESFIEKTVTKMTDKREEHSRLQKEQEIQAEFEEKFTSGMSKFNDFRDVVGALPFEITDAMTLGTRAMADPAAFIYAAAKRNPQELERISKIRDPYAQITEIGKLEERMRRNKPTTKAPRPLGRTQEDAEVPVPKKKTDPTIEDLIARSESKKLQRMRGRQGGRR